MGGYVFVLPHHMSTGHLDTASFERRKKNSSFVCIRYLSRYIQMGSVDLITRSYCLFRYVFFFFFSPSDINAQGEFNNIPRAEPYHQLSNKKE